MEGKQPGDELQVAVAPEDGYGKRNEVLEQEIPPDSFEGTETIELAAQFEVDPNAAAHGQDDRRGRR